MTCLPRAAFPPPPGLTEVQLHACYQRKSFSVALRRRGASNVFEGCGKLQRPVGQPAALRFRVSAGQGELHGALRARINGCG